MNGIQVDCFWYRDVGIIALSSLGVLVHAVQHSQRSETNGVILQIIQR